MKSPAATLTPASLQALAEAALVLEHAQGFLFLPLLVQSERAGAMAVDRLRSALKAEPFLVPWPLPQAHTDNSDESERRALSDLQAVLSALDVATRRLPSGAALLLDASSSARHAVARRLPVFLNQRREDWRRQGQHLLLVWPQAEREALLQGAPDLWSMRAAAPWVEEQDATRAMSLPAPVMAPPQTSDAITALSPAQDRQWRALQSAEHWADADLSAADVLALVSALRQNHQIGKALALAERLLNAPEFGQQTVHWQASLLMELAILRSKMGDSSGALAPAQEAVTIYRRLAKDHPAVYESQLAGSLNILANRLSATGDRMGALAPAQEAVEIYRRLSKDRATVYEFQLAGSLNNLANSLSELGDRASALVLAQEAAAIFRRLVQAHPAAYEPYLAGSLNNLATILSDAGDRVGALAQVQEAVAIYRRLAKAQPAAYEPHLAMSLNTLSNSLGETGNRAGALAPAQEALAIRRRLAQAHPAAYEPDLAMSLNNLAGSMIDAGDRVGALALAQEAVAICRRLAQAHPAAYESDLAMSLNNLANSMKEAKDSAGALASAQESVVIYRRLVQANPAVYEPHLAMSLGSLMECEAAAGSFPAARAAGSEALRLYTTLAERWPHNFVGYLNKTQRFLDSLSSTD